MDIETTGDIGESREISRLVQAARMLSEMTRIDEVKDVRDKAEAIRLYSRQRDESRSAQNAAAEIKIRAERRIGELLKTNGPSRGGDHTSGAKSNATTLLDMGITRDQSSAWQKIAGIPEPAFERHIEETKSDDEELTTAGVLRLAKQLATVPSDPKPWTTDVALARLGNSVGSIMDKSPEGSRPALARKLHDLAVTIDPAIGDVPDTACPDSDDLLGETEPSSTRSFVAGKLARLRSPFPWFGSKSKVAEIVWDRLGDVPNYIEPFFGSGAILLARPYPPQVETVNDLNHFVANFFRAVKKNPEGVAEWAREPVYEVDLHARHWWLTNDKEVHRFVRAMRDDPDLYHPKIAGWWAWGQCNWIGSGWCEHSDISIADGQNPHPRQARPDLGGTGKGLVSLARASTPERDRLMEYLDVLSDRLANVRVCCGDWKRICGPAPTTGLGLTAVLLDPPYLTSAGRYADLYASDSGTVAAEVREWAIAHGDDPLFRIALCGYEGEHVMPDSWECVEWQTAGGYGITDGNGKRNAKRERIWFSPHCIKPDRERSLFDGMDVGITNGIGPEAH